MKQLKLVKFQVQIMSIKQTKQKKNHTVCIKPNERSHHQHLTTNHVTNDATSIIKVQPLAGQLLVRGLLVLAQRHGRGLPDVAGVLPDRAVA